MAQDCDKACKNTEVDQPGFDQGFTHHIFTFKTNHVYADRKAVSLEVMMNQVMNVMEQGDHVCFNA
jgi:hypothetical protein